MSDSLDCDDGPETRGPCLKLLFQGMFLDGGSVLYMVTGSETQ